MKIETFGKLPDGFFQRFIIKVYTMNLFTECIAWNYGFKGFWGKESAVLCQHEKTQHSSLIKLQGLGQENAHHMWSILKPILKVSN